MHKQTPPQYSDQQGQSMVEYVLIVTLLVLALVVAVAATGPAIGNVFSNTVYNLLGTDPDDIEDLPDKDAFWLTVTWVSQQTPVEKPLPTSTKPKPTSTPTDGPSPTPSPTVPTNTPLPTWTPAPTETPKDLEFIAPWHDSADDADHWRLGGSVFLGADEGWYAEYFADRALTESSGGQYTSEIDEELTYNLDFDWGNGAPIEPDWPEDNPNNYFGVSFRREIYIPNETTLLFNLEKIDDGVRMWLVPGHHNITTLRPGGCSATGTTWGGNPSGSGFTIYDDDSPYPNDCLLLDGWGGNYGNTATVKRTVTGGEGAAGAYTLIVDMFDNSGGAAVKVTVGAVGFTGNPDDTTVDDSGNSTGNAADCRWNNPEDLRDSNSPDHRWDAWDSYAYGPGNRCYLELRGSVEIPVGMVDPVLTFWDVWDMRHPSMKAWVEVAEYDPDNDGIFDRDDLNWVPNTLTPLHQGDSTNYNWTYQRIDLRTLLGLTGTDTMEGKKYAIRFGMESGPSADYYVGLNSGYRLWWIDSINIDAAPQKSFYMQQHWDLDSAEQADDFITSGRWELTSAVTRGGGGMAWDDSPYDDYVNTNLDGQCSVANTCDYADENVRMHTIEFNGVVDLDDPTGASDLEGDTGDAMLTFWHAYDLDVRTGLEIQYTTDTEYNIDLNNGDNGEALNWKLVPDGQLIPRDQTNRPRQSAMTFVEINLEELKNLEPGANGKFRIRFVMTAGRNAYLDPGWWIDDIKLERAAISSFLPYPYIEDFEQEETINDWLLGGSWNRVDNRAYRPDGGIGHSLTDSPYSTDGDGNAQQETFAINQTSTATIRLAFDVNNDSPMNPFSPACSLIPSDPCTEPDNDLPEDPVMTFHWWHDFGSSGGENFYVDWKKADGDDATWQELWSYRDRMSYNSSSDSSTRRQWNWQRVEIDLRQIWASPSFENGVPDADTDDDILFRFRFETNGNNNGADGVYIDELHIVEREENTFAFWDAGVDQDVENPSFPSNDPLIYTTDSFRYVRFIADSEVNGNNYATIAEFSLLDTDGNDIPLDASMIESFSSERADNNDYIENMLDGDNGTQWFSQINPTQATYPHEFVLDLGSSHQISFFKILPRQLDPSSSYYQNGWIRDFRFYVSDDGSNWELAKDGQLAVTASEQTVSLQIDYTTNTAPSGSGTTTITGDGVTYRDNLDDNANSLFDNWYLGGTWEVIDWEQYDGVLAFHDSTSSPLNSGGDAETPPPNPTDYTRNSGRTFNVLEMSTILDMRATDASSLPIMTFWQRHHMGYGSNILVQIAYEDPDTIGDSGYCFSSTRDQCYDHLYGWSEWETAPPWEQNGYTDWNKSGEVRQYLWKREIVDLSGYAATDDDPGKRIRIRFVSESMDRDEGDSNLKDGWYIDNIEFKFNIPSVVNIDVDTGDSFFDAARNIRNWLREGTWGLSPEFFRGSGGGPADFGGEFWNYTIYDMTDCNSGNTGFRNCVRNRFDSWPNQNDGVGYIAKQGIALDINNDWGAGGPAGLSYMFAGIWELTTPVIGTTMSAGNYTFVFTYDEALRVKFDTVPGGDLPDIDGQDPYNPEWNIFNDFNVGGRQVNIGNALFENGKQYKIRMEWFDRWGDAALIVSLGSNAFSFTDSPKQAAGPDFDEVPAAPRSTSSLIFNGVFDLKDAVAPILQYYTYHELGGTAKVEVTTDGGFLWTQTGLTGSTPPGFWTTDWSVDFWDDRLRDSNHEGYMAYLSAQDSPNGAEEFNTTVYPPTVHVNSYYNGDLDFNWGSGSPYSGIPNDDFSAQFRRTFTLPTAMDVTFKVTSDDGHRMWINYNGSGYFPQCSFIGSDPIVSGRPGIGGEDYVIDNNTGSTACLLISDWEDGGNNYKEVTRNIPAGTHEVVLDLYENGGGAKIKLEVLAGSYDNPNYGGTWMPDDGDWRQKVHSLETYAGYETDGDPKPPIGLRFRLDRLGESETSDYTQANTSGDNVWMESWWITDVAIIDTVSGP